MDAKKERFGTGGARAAISERCRASGRSRWIWFGLVSCAALWMAGFGVPASGGRASAPADVSPASAAEGCDCASLWEKAFYDLLCELYMWLGGDCSDLPDLCVEDTMLTVVNYYEENGIPPKLSPSERAEMQAVAEDVHKYMQEDDGCLNPYNKQYAEELILQMIDELGS